MNVRANRFVVAALCCAAGTLLAASPSGAQVNVTVVGALGDLDGNADGGAGEAAVLQAVVNCWAARVGTARNFTLNVFTAGLTGGTIGQGAVTAVDGSNIPTAGRITMDNDGSTTYYVDAAPIDSLEFTPDPNNQWRLTGGPAQTDLYSVVNHEVGHAMAWLCGAPCGFTNPSYDALMNPGPGSFVSAPTCAAPFPRLNQTPLAGCVALQAGGGHPLNVPLRGDGLGGSGSSVVNELSHPGIAGDLMLGFYNGGTRELQSVNDVDLFAHAYGDAVNLPLSVSAGADVVSECNGTGGSNVTLTAGASTDPEGDALTFNWSCPGVTLAGATTANPSGFFLLDQTVTCRLDATDLAACPADADTVNVTVQDTTAPNVNCPADITVECKEQGGTTASDPAISAFLGAATANDVCDSSLGISNNAPAFFDVGVTTVVTFSTQDGSANPASCSADVTIADTTPPVISSVTATPNLLWPPNHQMVPVSLAVSVTDVCDAAATCQIVSVASNEPADALGDGSTAPDWQVTGALALNLRSERAGGGSGRAYTVTVQCGDDFNNTSTQNVEVRVVHDQS